MRVGKDSGSEIEHEHLGIFAVRELDPAFADMPIVRERREQELNCVLSNSFGFGGTNATLAFQRV